MVLPTKALKNFVVLELKVLDNVQNRWSQKDIRNGAPKNENVIALTVSCLKHHSKFQISVPSIHCLLSKSFPLPLSEPSF